MVFGAVVDFSRRVVDVFLTHPREVIVAVVVALAVDFAFRLAQESNKEKKEKNVEESESFIYANTKEDMEVSKDDEKD